jgi:hypothetical protein
VHRQLYRVTGMSGLRDERTIARAGLSIGAARPHNPRVMPETAIRSTPGPTMRKSPPKSDFEIGFSHVFLRVDVPGDDTSGPAATRGQRWLLRREAASGRGTGSPDRPPNRGKL